MCPRLFPTRTSKRLAIRSGDTPVPTELRRQKCRRSLSHIALLASPLLAGFIPIAQAAPFTPGNVVIYRVGTGSEALASTGNPVFLDEYSTTGTLVQSLPLPTAASGPNRRLVAAGNATAEGQLTRSTDGRFLVATGYDASIPYISALPGTAANTVFRTIGRVDHTGNVDTSTYLQDFADGGGPRSAITADGSAFWMTGSTGGVRYAPFGATVTSTQLTTAALNFRQLAISGAQLYASSSLGATPRIGTIGSGLPTTAGQTVTGLPGFPATGSPYGFFFADLSPAVAGNDTLYVADDLIGLQKFSQVGDTWVANGTIGTATDYYRGVAATVSGGAVTLYAIRKALGAPGGGELVTLTDSTGYNGAFAGTPTLLATAAANTAFRGVAAAPYLGPDLTVEVSAPATATVGLPFDYTITARNLGNQTASNIGVAFIPPNPLTPAQIGNLAGSNGFVGGVGATVTFSGGTLAPGASAVLTVQVTPAAAGNLSTLSSTAQIDPAAAIPESDETNNGSTQLVSTVVSPASSAYEVWMNGFFPGETDPHIIGRTQDPDGDGTKNLLEFTLNGNPGSPDPAILPEVSSAGEFFIFNFRRKDTSDSETLQTVEYGSELVGWTPAVAGVNGVVINEFVDGFGVGTDRIEVKIPRSLAPVSGLYGRLKIATLDSSAVVYTEPNRFGTIAMDYVPVGNPDNPAGGNGAVAYEYRIGKYEVTNSQYAEFLNAVAQTDTYGLYNDNMGSDARGGITRSGNTGSFVYTLKSDMGNKPVNYVSWYDAARFTNWLHNDQPTGLQTISTTERGAYTLTGNTGLPTKSSSATVWLPSQSEWYKAAYFDPTSANGAGGYWAYPTRSNSIPTVGTATTIGDIGNPGANVANYANGADWNGQDGNVSTVGGTTSASYFGTSDQGGNVSEWIDEIIDFSRGVRGGSWGNTETSLRSSTRSFGPPTGQFSSIGFRVASVASPSTLIPAFGLPGRSAVIDHLAKTIVLTVPAGTDVANLAPAYTVSDGATGNPTSGTARNFSTPQTYTITAEDLSFSVYTVTVITDATPPLLASHDIVDDKNGDQIPVAAQVTYMVYFNEDVDEATVSPADFGNAGSAAISIGSVAETAPGVFSVQVTPTTPGTLQLQVNPNATITDLAGNPLNTLSAIVDDTVLAVASLAITTQPASQTIASGATATLSVTATGTEPLSYQWYRGISGDTTTPVGTNAASFTTPVLTSTTRYWVRVTNSFDPAANSNTATVTVGSPAADFTWTSSGTAITITGYTGPGGVIGIPSQINGLPVSTIGGSAFNNKLNVTRVNIPSSVNSIGSSSFNGCTGLTAITVEPANVFFSSLDGVLFNKSLTTLIRYPSGKAGAYILPPSVTSIGSSAFSDCSGLTSVTLSARLTSIGGLAFSFCSGLTSITLPASLTGIGTSAFRDCSGLTTVTIPAGVTTIGNYPFYLCTGLTAITVDAANPSYSSLDGVLFNKARTILIQYPCSKTGTYNPPSSVTTIGTFAFLSCSGLTSITLPASLISIGDHAFSGCRGLTSVTLPASLTTIGTSAFYVCSGLTSVTLPASLTSIGSYAFSGCSGLTTVTIPASVTTIGSYAFSYCTGLNTAFFAGNAPTMGTAVFGDTAAGFKISYLAGNSGFTSPAWLSYPASEIPLNPTITTGPASSVAATTATLNGTVNPNGRATTAQFEYGLTTDYGSTVSVNLAPADGTTVQNVSAGITGLEQGQTYHYRLIATSIGGSSSGQDAIFTAAPSNTLNRVWVGAGPQTFPTAIWGGAANWSTGVAATGTDSIATFGNSFANGYACIVNSAWTIGRIVYNDPANANDFILQTHASDHILTLDVTSGLASINVAQAGRTLIIQPRIGGNDGFAKNGPGRLVLANANSPCTGPIRINAGLLEIGGGLFTVNNGKAAPDYVEQAFNLGTTGRVGNGNYAGSVLIAGGAGFLYNSSADTVLNGVISGDGSLGKAGTGTLTITNTNTYTGTTTVSGGSVRLGSSSSLPAATDFVLEGGKLDLNGQNATIRSLAVTGADVLIDFGTTNSANTLQIIDGALAGWTGNLLIQHFNPATDQLFFATNAAGLGGNAARVSFVDPVGFAPGTYALNSGGDGTAFPGFTPAITTLPESQTISHGATATLTVAAIGSPAPSFQWYQGDSGDTTTPVGTNAASFSTPALTSATRYWVRVSNLIGSVNSATATITVNPPSRDASLAGLELSGAPLSPAFAPAVTNYSAWVGAAVPTITVTPVTSDPNSVIRLNGTLVPSGVATAPVSLSVGLNTILLVVTAQDGIATRSYTLNVTRAAPTLVTTLPAGVVDARSVKLNGSVTPNGVATVFFEYGETPAYGSTTAEQEVSGNEPLDFEASLSGLTGSTGYHFRAVAVSAGGTVLGEDRFFTTTPDAPVAATGNPAAVTNSGATLVGAVDPNGLATSVYFEYGLTTLYGKSTPVQSIPAGSGIVDVVAPNGELIPNATYHYRIVANNPAGTAFGNDVIFGVQAGSGVPNASPNDLPAVETRDAIGIGTDSAILRGRVDPNEGTTVVQFEYGTSTAYGRTTAAQGVGNGNDFAEVSLPVTGLLPGTDYHYRITASNSLGKRTGAGGTFRTRDPAPAGVTGGAEILSTTSARIRGAARARGPAAEVWVDYGTDGVTFNSVRAVPPNVSGQESIPVSAELPDLAQGVRYFYRVRATRSGVEGIGNTGFFDVATLSGLIQQFPDGVAPGDRQGAVNITLSPGGIGGGWRFAGEQTWRESGVPATGLTRGDRVIEYRPVAGRLQPPNEAVAVSGGALPIALERAYVSSGATGAGSLTVILKPQDLTENIAPARWRFYGEGEQDWKESGVTVTGLPPGNHVILSKEVDGRSTPPPVTASVADGQAASITITYFIKEQPVGTPPGALAFETVSNGTDLPYAYVGQIRGDAGSGSGFVVRPRVVATVGHVVFDDGTLVATTGLQWLFQRDKGVHEPRPLTPRGYYLMTGYAAQRAADNSPGTSSPASQNLDAATLFFVESAGRGGFGGYLASDSNSNEFLLSPALKTLAGYPIDGIPAEDQDRMHATPPGDILFSKAFGRTYTTSDIRASGGASGGPVCVRYQNGNYYPAAIYLGGTNQTVVRAIDSAVANLIGFAESSSGDGVGQSGGSVTDTSTTPVATPALGSLKVLIEPASALAAGAGWRVSSQASYQPGGSREDDLSPNTYSVRFPTLDGFVPPAPQPVAVAAGLLTTITFTYEAIISPPVIGSPGVIAGVRGQAMSYQITASNSPEVFSLQGILPDGMSFNANTGLISGTPLEAGKFDLNIGASNTGGADSRPLVLTSSPVIAPQAITAPYGVALSRVLASSESGGGVTWTADDLPAGLRLDPASGVISGTPEIPGLFEVPISVTRFGATAGSLLTLTLTGTPPQITLQPAATRTIAYGGSTSLSVEASGLPDPQFQWYQGTSGDIGRPVSGATAATFTTPPLFAGTSYWVRASSISGSTDSSTSVISLLPSANANLANLLPGAGTLSPAFNGGVLAYSVSVPNAVSSITLTPTVEVPQSTVRINGTVVAPDSAAGPFALTLGPNPLAIEVTAGDGTSVKNYQVTVTRMAPPAVTTGLVADVAHGTATLLGSANPNGAATVFFQYGLTTAYGNTTPGREISGSTPVDFTTLITGLAAETEYHYRAGITSGSGTFFGDDMTFTTTAAPPLVATGDPASVTPTGATLVGAVDPNGLPTTVFFEYGPDTGYGRTSPPAVVSGDSVQDVIFTAVGLVPGAGYHYRLVATSDSGTAVGEDVPFVATQGSGAGNPPAAPTAETGGVTDPGRDSAILIGTVDPNNATTFVRFDYGLTSAYGSSTASVGVGNGDDAALVTRGISGLLPGTTYHYRVVATNSQGSDAGEDATFTTKALAPLATTGDAVPLTASSARITGTARGRGALANVFIEYGTDGVTFSRVPATPGSVNGDAETLVSRELIDLLPRTTYYYRVVVERPGGADAVTGTVKSFQADALIGYVQRFSREVPAGDRDGRVTVNLSPAGTGGWRFAGEQEWRAGGTTVAGMTTGDREIEFRPVSGFVQPPRELAGIISGAPALVIGRQYVVATGAGSAGLRVRLEPAALADPEAPVAARLQWRLAGDSDTAWRNSGDLITGMMPGSYLVECKAVPGRNTPAATHVVLAEGEIKDPLVIAYAVAGAPPLNPPQVLPFATVSTSRNLPYAYVGQIRNDSGAHSGFVVKPRVVATTAQAVFNEETLAQVTGMQWLLQRDRDNHEPKPQLPRGSYVSNGYAAQRRADATPGTVSLAAQNDNVAALFFTEDAGRGGFSGFLASDAEDNGFLISPALKSLVGYPVNGIPSANEGRMHATPPAAATFTLATGRTFASGGIRGLGGMAGGPLCVQLAGGSYYPAGIHLGGSTQTLVRAIDGTVVDLFNRAENTANTGDDNTSGGISLTSFSSLGTSSKGQLAIVVEPAAARATALWKLPTDSSYRPLTNQPFLDKATYQVQLRPLAGFQTPPPVSVDVVSGILTTLTFTYLPELSELETWRSIHFGTTANSGIAADSFDADGDGSKNLDEYVAVTDPRNGRDVFRVESTELTAAGFKVTTSGKSGRRYQLEHSTTLGNATWTTVASTAGFATDGQVILTHPAPPPGAGFYRVVVELAAP